MQNKEKKFVEFCCRIKIKIKRRKQHAKCLLYIIHVVSIVFKCIGRCMAFMLLFNKHNYISSVLSGVYKECCLIILW